MTTLTREEIEHGLAENRGAPGGAARNAHAEALAGAAEVSGDPDLFRAALDNLINAYLYSAESPKLLVPFARLLQEYDKDPGSFSDSATHSLFWQFKWVATAINNSPDIPLESAAGWLDDMERRYRIAGYSERPVREAEMWLADVTGDDERAERAFDAWRGAERDGMSDCHACEDNSQGQYAALRGDDAQALDAWKPVLEGQRLCAEEPHRVLAASLLPLLRLGRFDEARSHHLRGYRLVRGNESLLPSVGKHIEFCALTGNESRGLEILAEHAPHMGPPANDRDQLVFHGGVLVLLRRLRELGHGQSPAVPYNGVPHSVSELYDTLLAGALDSARRFDVRNGTTRISDRFLARIEREPLVGMLPLGVRSHALPSIPSGGPAPAVVAAPVQAVSGDLTELVGRARAARDQGHPAADALWTEVAARLEAFPADEVDPLISADVADHRALTAARGGAADAAELLTAVRDTYRALGQAERAALAQLRLATVAAQSGADPAEIKKLLRGAVRDAESLDPADPLRTRRIALAELASIRVDSYLRSVQEPAQATEHAHGPGDGHGHREGHGHAEMSAELAAFIDAYAQPLPDVAAEAEELLGRVTLAHGDPEHASSLLASAAARGIDAGRPWNAVDPLVLRAGVLSSLGRPEEAEEAARSACRHVTEVIDAETQGVVRLTLADILLRRANTPDDGAEGPRTDGAKEAAEHALTAAHWFDQAGLSADGGAQARLLLARAYARIGRTADAAEVLQSALPDLLEHGEGQAVAAHEFLGDLLRELREWRPSAEQYLRAAEIAQGWEDSRPQAGFAQSAADQLSTAGLVVEAVAAYERALRLHREAGGAPVAEVRILRSLAWLGLRSDVTEAVVTAARTRMDEAADVLASALAHDPRSRELRSELAQTWHQMAQVLDRWVTAREEAAGEAGGTDGAPATGAPATGALREGRAEIQALRLEEILLWEQAAGLYAELGPEYIQDRLQCLNNAAWTEHELHRPQAGAARISALIEEIRALPEGAVPEWVLPQAERIVAGLLS
ncbi:tetratricopeptide repeat protein [Streptomyces sp. NPDC046557]|uniref:tetratricopeptide repeat protein n=1 Tax=Streptomyces sp. NPDC046557 TaxID=3155372 RepID=UPI0033E6C1B3